jgi:hypothetical protein
LGSAVISATVEEESTISATFSGTAGDGSILLSYAPTSEDNSSLDLLSGVYVSGGGNRITTLSIDPNGAFTGQDSQGGCVYNGAFSIINSDENLYNFRVNVANCLSAVLNGDYTGFGTIEARDALFVIAFDPSAMRVGAPSPVFGIMTVRQ